MPHILLVGRKGSVLDDARTQLDFPDLEIHYATSIDDVRFTFSEASADNISINHVFIGAGIELDKRLEIIKEVFALSLTSYVHSKDVSSGVQGFTPFVNNSRKG